MTLMQMKHQLHSIKISSNFIKLFLLFVFVQEFFDLNLHKILSSYRFLGLNIFYLYLMVSMEVLYLYHLPAPCSFFTIYLKHMKTFKIWNSKEQINCTQLMKVIKLSEIQQNNSMSQPNQNLTPTYKVSPPQNQSQKKQQKGAFVNTAGKVGKSHHEYLKIMSQQKGPTQFRGITFQQLSYHNKKQSAWLSLNGIVYDVTIYMNFHPGGSILLDGCGKQCSDLFNQYHPWVNAKYLLEKYKIGFLSR